MVFRFRPAAVTIACLVVACTPPSRLPGIGRPLPASADAPYELGEDDDLGELRDRYLGLASDSAEAEALRGRLVDEYARRIDARLAKGDQDGAYTALASLVSLWSGRELSGPAPARLTAQLPRVRALHDRFARAGGDIETVATLALMMLMEPDRAADHAAEVDEIFAYDDDLAISEYGDGARRARPIQVLEAIVTWLPSRYVVDTLTELYLGRQKAIDQAIRRSGNPDYDMIRAQGDGVLRTAWHLIRIHAYADRLADVAPAVHGLVGIGSDPPLRRRLTEALGEDADATSWILLSASFRGEDKEHTDLPAALALDRIAIARFPDAPEAYLAAGEVARELNRLELAIALYQRGLALDPRSREAADELATLYQHRLGRLVRGDRPAAAQRCLAEIESFQAAAAKRWPKRPLSVDVAAALATLGEGLVRLGELDRARDLLTRSVKRRPNATALEYLGTMALKHDRFEAATRFFDQALTLSDDDLGQRFTRARILRLAATAYAGAGDPVKARSYAHAGLAVWRDLARLRLRPRYQAERQRESGKLLWQLGSHDAAMHALETALDLDPDGAATHADVIAFLVAVDQPERALDAYHRALGSPAIAERLKVSMSLWLLTLARSDGRAPDPSVVEYLAGRDGELWHDDLARFAVGKASRAEVEAGATSRSRRAKLLYYSAMLSPEADDPSKVRASMRGVLATDMVMAFEYDMAKRWLEAGARLHPPESTSRRAPTPAPNR